MKNLITCLTVCVLSGATFADTWTVDDDGKADFDNIQAAINAASDGDEIVVMPGTYTSTANEVVNMLGKAVWLHSGKGAELTIIDGEGTRRGIICANGETSKTIIEGFTITGGYATSGGGMKNSSSSSPTLTDCTFTNNTASVYGGGMRNNDSSPTLTNCTFTNNHATSGGGMLNDTSNPTLDGCTFTDNTANDYGGGMYNYIGNPTLTDCTFTSNTSLYGGGMYNFSSSTTLTDCTFTANSAEYEGGGVCNYASNSTLDNCTFTGNTASSGGGMYNISSSPTLDNCTFTGNTANSSGGGMYNALGSSNPTLTDTTVCGNTPDQIYGNWIDNGGNTIAEVCPLNQGACCTNDNCLVSEQENCLAFFGEWQGEGTTCVNNPCPTSCLGDISGDGQVNVNDLLILIAAWGACP